MCQFITRVIKDQTSYRETHGKERWLEDDHRTTSYPITMLDIPPAGKGREATTNMSDAGYILPVPVQHTHDVWWRRKHLLSPVLCSGNEN